MALTKITNSAIADDIGLGGNPTTSTQTAGDSTTRIATTAFVSTAVANLVDSAPDTLNTLAELATSIGNNATLSSTLTSSIATKLPLAGGTLTGHLNLGDNVIAKFGLDSDLQIYHDGSNSYINDTGTGSLIQLTNSWNLNNSADTQNMITATESGAVLLFNSGSGKLATTTTGISISNNANFPDNGKAIFGAGSDLQIYHDGSNSYIAENGTGDLYIKATSLVLSNSAGANYLVAYNGGSVNLYHNANPKLATTTTGIDVTGNIGVTGTVDGVDIAARDAVLTSTTTTAGAALPKAGGTMTGALIGTSATFSPSSGKTFVIASDSGDGPYIGTSGNQSLRIITNNTTRMTIAAAGAVTIPGSLNVTGNLVSDNYVGTAASLNGGNSYPQLTLTRSTTHPNVSFTQGVSNFTGAGTDLIFGSAGASLGFGFQTKDASSNNINAMVIDPDGNVGIGTTAPGHLLDILKSGSGDATVNIKSTTGGDPTLIFNSAAANRQGIIKFQDNGTNVGRIDYVHNGDRMDFQAGSATGATMSIKNGAVGIGTTSPLHPLHIQHDSSTVYSGTSDQGGGIYVNNIHYSALQGFSQIRLGVSGGSGASYARLVAIEPGQAQSDFAICLRNSSTYFERLRIKGLTGNIGIGTDAPAHKLQVEGAIKTNPPVATGNRQRSVQTWETSFSMLGTTATNWDMTKFNEGGAGNAFLVEAFWSHYASAAHALALVAIVHTRGTDIYQQTIYNYTHSYNGSFTISAPSATTLRINKLAGTYGGTGYGTIRVTSYQP